MRLIDADALLDEFYKNTPYGCGFVGIKYVDDLIKSFPTAFNVERIIQQIDLKSFDYYTKSGAVIDVDDACDIIRKGGIPNDI